MCHGGMAEESEPLLPSYKLKIFFNLKMTENLAKSQR